ncbi:3-oxoacyl-[acyl-carrier-protein] reductase [Collinsella intestinalis]|uniref:3-oxoacyl-[acyl-carrier-protein] reductase n=1 Tax=Collinsella intestinalis TaxID=147207 RepID=UPI00195B0618|nr:3-oxoacyl-[acyl-carrier-protein] reductase [Collinsella intestinalis]MBM6907991.1 3-oxoacyl-[acyl-carrier-protein] reductase [Collinsella intestinalis]
MQETSQNLAGKCAIVTGGSRGIGRAVVLELARRGANIVFSYAGNAAAAEETRASAAALGVEVRAVKANATDPAAAPALVDAAKELGGVDILVNNAGITRDKLAARMSAEDFEAVIATNLTGAFLMTKAVLRPMMRARAGVIVNLSSVVGLRGNAGQANYAASKAGLIGLTKSIAREVAGAGIRVNAVAPGFIATDMTDAMPEAAREATLAQIPAGHLGAPEDVAHAIAFLVSDDAAYITGQVLAIDGGMSM